MSEEARLAGVADPEISAIIPVGSRHAADIRALCADYRRGLDALGLSYEIVIVLDGPMPDLAAELQRMLAREPDLAVLALTRRFGEATSLMAGFQRARGRIILTLPAYPQVEGGEIVRLVRALGTADLVIARRSPRAGTRLEALRRRAFHGLIASVTGQRYQDLGCGARAMKRRVLEEITLYGDQHRFLPVLATRQGFRVLEVDVRQSSQDRRAAAYPAREYLRRALDIFTVFFLVRFTKKPLRFFGMLGAAIFALGSLLVGWLAIDRLFLGHPLADRPALLLSSLLVVLGLQLLALGLLGELIIFTHARDIRDYQIDEIIRHPQAPSVRSESRAQAETATPY